MGYQLLLNTNQEIKMRWDDYQKMGLFCYICLVDLVLQKLLFHSRKKKQVLSQQNLSLLAGSLRTAKINQL